MEKDKDGGTGDYELKVTNCEDLYSVFQFFPRSSGK